MLKIILLVISLAITSFFAKAQWQSNLLTVQSNNKLVYHPDADGYTLPDFSHAGYKGGGIEIPSVPVLKTISPVSGDNTVHIQTAINSMAVFPLNADGIRGALLLNAGVYEIWGSLNVGVSGVVIRGVGNGTSASNSTILIAKGNTPNQRDVLVAGNLKRVYWDNGIKNLQNITTDLLPSGANSFSIDNGSSFEVGDQVVITHPCTEAWLEAVDYGGMQDVSERWKINQLPIVYNRYITQISGNVITVDAPFFYTLNKVLAQSTISHFNTADILTQIGLENFRIDIETAGGEDEKHAWQAIRYKSIENSWANNVVVTGFGQSGFITEGATRITIQNCEALDPVGIVMGERMYNFNTYSFSQLILFKNCIASNGRHHYVSNGTSSVSGNVFLHCVSSGINNVSEGHRQWTSGMLFDNHTETNLKREYVLGLYNRGDYGTGHGWSAVNSVLWNCDVTSSGSIYLQKPPTAQNYAIGCTAKRITHTSPFSGAAGYIEGLNQAQLQPASLYLAQLEDRTTFTSIGQTKVKLIDYSFNKDLGVLHVKLLNEYKECKLALYNISGMLLKTEKMVGNEAEITWTGFSKGIYLIHVSSDKASQTIKIMY